MEWKKIYSITHPSSRGKEGFFKDQADAKNRNAQDESADLFSILDQLEEYRLCSGDFHIQLCYPELEQNYSFPCNEWTQFNNPVLDSLISNYKPINITFQSETADFQGLSMSARGKADNLIDDYPYFQLGRSFSVGTIKGKDGKIAGPGGILVEKVELFVNPGQLKIKVQAAAL